MLIESALWEPLNIARTGRDARHHHRRALPLRARRRSGNHGAGPRTCDHAWCSTSAAATPTQDRGGRLCRPSRRRSCRFPVSEVKRLTGLDVPKAESLDILTRLGFEPSGSGDVVDVSVPSWRPDVDGKADLVEEVMRIHGVDKIAPQPLASHDAVNGKILTTLQIRTPRGQARARRARHDGGRDLVVHSGEARRSLRRRPAGAEACQPDRRRHVGHAALAAAGADRRRAAQCRPRLWRRRAVRSVGHL